MLAKQLGAVGSVLDSGPGTSLNLVPFSSQHLRSWFSSGTQTPGPLAEAGEAIWVLCAFGAPFGALSQADPSLECCPRLPGQH